MPVISSPYRVGPAGAPLGRVEVLAFALAVMVCRLFAIYSFHIYDDAFITFRYAQNLAAGNGLVFNPGAPWEPVLGTTTPGYALALSLPCRLGLPVIQSALTLNILCDGISALLLMQLLRARPIAAILAALAFAVIPEIGRISVGGMEPPLFAVLALGAVAALETRRFQLAGWLAALDCTVRPEAVMLVAILAVMYLRSWREIVSFAIPVAVVGLIATVGLSWIYGQPIPQSVRAKAGGHGLGPHLSRVAAILAQGLGPSLAMRAAVPVAGLGFALAFLWRTPARAFIAFGLAIVSAYCAVGVKTWGWYFFVPLTAWCAALGIGVDATAEFLARAKPAWRMERPSTGASLALAASVVVTVALFARAYPDRVTPHVYGAMREWIAKEHIQRDKPTILASDIGAIGFYSDTQILDSEGLVWPEARKFGWQLDVIKAHRPDYLMLVVTSYRLEPFINDPIAALYEPLARFTTTDDERLAPDVASLPFWWEQDYIVYRRRDYAKRTE